MANKPSAKAIAKLNATTLFPEIKKEIEKNPSLYAIRGFFIFNITKKGVPMTEWYLLFQGFDAPAAVSQKRPEIPKAKREEQPIPVAIFQLEDSDLLNFMSGGLTGSRGIVSGKIKIAGAMELAEQLEEIFRKAKGADKTLAYLEHKRGKSEKARARLSSESKAAPSKVQSLARRYSAMAKQADSNYVPQNNISKAPINTGATKTPAKVSPTATSTTSSTAAVAAAVSQPLTQTPEVASRQEEDDEDEERQKEVELKSKDTPLDVEKEIESTLQVADLSKKVQEVELVENTSEKEQETETETQVKAETVLMEEPVHQEPAEEPVQEQEQQEAVVEPEAVQEKEEEPVQEERKEEEEEKKEKEPEVVKAAVIEAKSETEAPVVEKEAPAAVVEEETKSASDAVDA
ncbi:hypothetical protein KVV02_000482 [Mortierella alpina]|uniref:SCP2 domain-containing protein n=1 Tax=Mortierella alpina TaxID=64518 RepID=A0A9P8A516_MORAP|nr:hypothetical protein KVV02_000482 [Mortierella alpina]